MHVDPLRHVDLPKGADGKAWLVQHTELEVKETMRAGQKRARNKLECRLDWYWERMHINDRQHEAGIRFRADWQLAAEEPRVTSGYGQRISGSADFTAARIAARRRIGRALTIGGVSGEEMRVLVAVCGMDEWAAGRLPTLREALTTLADHYGLEK